MDLINEDYEVLKFYRKQNKLLQQRVDTLAARIAIKDKTEHLQNDQIKALREKEDLHLARYDQLSDKYFDIVLENEGLERKKRFWTTITAVLASLVTYQIVVK